MRMDPSGQADDAGSRKRGEQRRRRDGSVVDQPGRKCLFPDAQRGQGFVDGDDGDRAGQLKREFALDQTCLHENDPIVWRAALKYSMVL